MRGKNGGHTIQEKWEVLKGIVTGALLKGEWKIKKKSLGFKDWWDYSYTRMKRKVHRSLRKWKQEEMRRKRYIEMRGELKEFLKEKRKKKRLEEEEELRNIRNKTEAWKFINKKRGKKTWTEDNISMERRVELLESSGKSQGARGKIHIEEGILIEEERRDKQMTLKIEV